MNKFLIICVLGLLLVSGISLISLNNEEEVKEIESKQYQGPVPKGYDLEHFIKTGETIEKVIIKNPRTGEVWNSVEEFENRELNLGENN